MVSRRTFLRSALAAGAAGTGWAGFFEPRWLAVRRARCPMPGLASPVRLAHLSDLHASVIVPDSVIDSAVEAAVAARPDLICVTGDFITGQGGFDRAWYARALGRLASAAPCFGVLGNHDGGSWAIDRSGFASSQPVHDMVQSTGIRMLHNRNTVVNVPGTAITLAGTGDLWSLELRALDAFHGVGRGQPCILLSHNPDGKEILYSMPWHLMLSGHTHGGQVVVPYVGSPWAPVADKRYLAGLKPFDKRWIHVSAGVGSAGGFRVNCRPEITLLELVPATASFVRPQR